MADDRLRMQAEVTDGFTAPLGRMETALRRTGQTAKQVGQAAQSDWAPLAATIGKTRTALEGLTPALGALGVGSLGAGLALGGTITALRNFSTSTRDASLLAKELGLTTNELRAFGRVGEEVGVSANTMQGGLKGFQNELSQLRKRWGETYIQLESMGLGGLVEKIIAAPNMRRAVEEAMQGLATITDPVKRRKVAELFFHSEDFARVAAEMGAKIKQVWAGTIEDIGVIGPATERAAKDFEKNMGRIGDAAERLKIDTLGPILEGFVGALDHIENRGVFGQKKNAPASKRSTFEEEDLDAQMRGGRAQTPAEKANQSRVEAIQKRLAEAGAEVEYNRKRLVQDPAETRRLTDEIRRLNEELRRLREQGGATVQQQSFGGPLSGGARILQASYGGGGGFGGVPGMGQGFGGGGGAPIMVPNGALSRGGSGGPLSAPKTALPSGGGGASAPRGDGRGNPRAARTGDMMAWAMDQLRREGVPEANLRQAAAHLVGQAFMESGLDPNKTHDGGTGYGIYGARDPRGWGNYKGARRSDMIRWLEANGYARNSAEGQMREMAHRAMSGQYRRTRAILMGEGTGNVVADTNAITGEFEAPKRINHRAGAVMNAYRAGPSEQTAGPDGEQNTGMSRLRDSDIEARGSGERMGDAMMRRLYGDQAPVTKGPMTVDGKASLHIQFDNAPAGMRTSTSADGLFKDVSVSKRRQIAM